MIFGVVPKRHLNEASLRWTPNEWQCLERKSIFDVEFLSSSLGLFGLNRYAKKSFYFLG